MPYRKRQNPPQSQQTALPDKYPQGKFNPKPCRWCGLEFKPKAPSHLYCSQECSDHANADKYYTRTYGISLNEFMDMHTEQDARCAICDDIGFKIEQNAKALLAVDHCHTTGRVRGLLCHNCNRALGLFQDSVANLEAAIAYLRRTK